MIIVTGHGRSATSTMMRIVGALGVRIFGTKHPFQVNPEINPTGFFEYESTLKGNLSIVPDDAVVKVILHHVKDASKHIKATDKIIHITRDIQDVAKSQVLCRLSAFSVTNTVEWLENNDTEYNQWLGDRKELVVSLNDLIADPEKEVTRIKEYIGSTESINKAISLVKRE